MWNVSINVLGCLLMQKPIREKNCTGFIFHYKSVINIFHYQKYLTQLRAEIYVGLHVRVGYCRPFSRTSGR